MANLEALEVELDIEVVLDLEVQEHQAKVILVVMVLEEYLHILVEEVAVLALRDLPVFLLKAVMGVMDLHLT
jgi:hypothetical protein